MQKRNVNHLILGNMKKNTFLGIGTLILSDEIVLAYVNTILDIIHGGGVTFNDTRNICETLVFLRDNYKGNETVEALLSKAASCVYTLFIDNTVVDLDDDDTLYALLGIKTILV